ncbi:MAG TPA: hypothetical protein ENH82_09640 [bacterium]|nr:hypothetical protein [bacterium]
MTREKAILAIDSLFPTDSEYPETNKIGIELLEEAKHNVENWRNLPDAVLFEYARLCEEREAEANRKFLKEH